MKDAYYKFKTQKQAAKQRNIEWQLTFEEWSHIWEQSGKAHLRGKGKGKYCMCRFNDTGPYSVNNVYIDRFERNAADVWTNNGDHIKQMLSAMHTGKTLTDAHKSKISASSARGKEHRYSKPCSINGVRYESMREARLALGMTEKAMVYRLRSTKPKFTAYQLL